eukprot:3513789-Rhodomonas_salina.1
MGFDLTVLYCTSVSDMGHRVHFVAEPYCRVLALYCGAPTVLRFVLRSADSTARAAPGHGLQACDQRHAQKVNGRGPPPHYKSH